MGEKSKPVGISLPTEIYENLKTAAKKMGVSGSSLVKDLIEKYLNTLVNDGSEIFIMLKVPAHYKNDKEGLRQLLIGKANAITESICKPKVVEKEKEKKDMGEVLEAMIYR
jgi:hypothetical protein